MVDIVGGYGKLKTWVSNRFLRNKDDRMTGDFEMWAAFKTDKYLESDKNLFLGVGVCGGGALSHSAGNEGYNNVGLGYQSLYSLTTGAFNSALGDLSLRANTSGSWNLAIGSGSLYRNTTGIANVASGVNALQNNVGGGYNSGIGQSALFANIGGWMNTGIGGNALFNQQGGSHNVGIGFEAGKGTTAHDKSDSVFIGYKAGRDENTSNKLYIANDETATPLIYGEFDNNKIGIKLKPAVSTFGVAAIPTYATDAAAGTAGLIAGEFYKHADGSLHVKL